MRKLGVMPPSVRPPPLKVIGQRVIKGTDAELHKQMHPSGRPLHLLLLCEALCDDLVDGRFHEGGRDCFAISSSLAIARDHAGIGSDIAFEDRKSVVLGKSVSVRVDFGGRRVIKKK